MKPPELPGWVRRRSGPDLKANEVATIEWKNNQCRRGGEAHVLGEGVGWLAITKGSCFRSDGGRDVPIEAPAILLPHGLPLSSKPDRAWASISEEMTLRGGASGCSLEYWWISDDELEHAKYRDGTVEEDFEKMRPLFRKSGGAPYLHHLHKRSDISELFEGMSTGDLELESDVTLESIETLDGADGWRRLVDFNEAPKGLMLVLDGWVRFSANVGAGLEAHPRLIDVLRPPVLIGDAERPRPACGWAQPLAGLHRIEVKGLERWRGRVHYLVVPYDRLQKWYNISEIDARLSAYSTAQAQRFHAWLSVGTNQTWRVIRWILDEHQQKQRLGSDPRIWIPKRILGLKHLAATQRCNSDPRKWWNAASDLCKEVQPTIDRLSAMGLIVRSSPPDSDFVELEVVPGQEENLRSALCAAARDAFWPGPAADGSGAKVTSSRKSSKRRRAAEEDRQPIRE